MGPAVTGVVGTGVFVSKGVAVGPGVLVTVGTPVGVFVGVGVEVKAGVGVGVSVGVDEGATVPVTVGVGTAKEARQPAAGTAPSTGTSLSTACGFDFGTDGTTGSVPKFFTRIAVATEKTAKTIVAVINPAKIKFLFTFNY